MDKEIKEWDLDQDWENDDENYDGVERRLSNFKFKNYRF